MAKKKKTLYEIMGVDDPNQNDEFDNSSDTSSDVLGSSDSFSSDSGSDKPDLYDILGVERPEVKAQRLQEEEDRKREEQRKFQEDEQKSYKEGVSPSEYRAAEEIRQNGNIFQKAWQAIQDTGQKLYEGTRTQTTQETITTRQREEGDQYINNSMAADVQLKDIETQIDTSRQRLDTWDQRKQEFLQLSPEIKESIRKYDTDIALGKAKPEDKPSMYDKYFDVSGVGGENPGNDTSLLQREKARQESRIEALNSMADSYRVYLGKMDNKRDIISGVVGAFSTGSDRVKKLPFAGQAIEYFEKSGIKTAMEKYTAGEDLSEKELDMVRQVRSDLIKGRIDTGYGESVGEMIANMPTYMAEFVMTGGLASAGKTAATKVIGTAVEKGTVEAITKGIARTAIGELTRTSIGFVPHIANKTAEYMLPRWDVVAGENGDSYIAEVDKGDDFAKAFTKAGLSTYVENLSESAGLLVEEATPFIKKAVLGKFLEKTAAKTGVELTEETSKTLIQSIMKAGGWNGVIGEVFEEEIAEPAQAAIEGREYKNPITTPEGRERLLTETLGIVIFQGIASIPDVTIKKLGEARDRLTNKGMKDVIDIPIKEGGDQLPSDYKSTQSLEQQGFKQFDDLTTMLDPNNSIVDKETLKQSIEAEPDKWKSVMDIANQSKSPEDFQTKVQRAIEDQGLELPSVMETKTKTNVEALKNQAKDLNGDGKISISEMVGRTGSNLESNKSLETLSQDYGNKKITPEQYSEGLGKLAEDIKAGKFTDNVAASTLKQVEEQLTLISKQQTPKSGFLNKPLPGTTIKSVAIPENIPTFTDAQGLVAKEGGVENIVNSSLPAQNVYAAEQIASTAGLDSEYLYNEATKKGVPLNEFLTEINNAPTTEAKTAVGETLMNILSNTLNLNVTTEEDEKNRITTENQGEANKEQNKETKTSPSNETVWETAITSKEDIRDSLDEGEQVVLDYLETERLDSFEKSANKALETLDTAMAGFRYSIDTEQGREYKGQKSTFPDWFSLRTTTEIQDFLKAIPDDVFKWTLENNPFKEGSKKSEAWTEFIKQISPESYTSIFQKSESELKNYTDLTLDQLTTKVSELVQTKINEKTTKSGQLALTKELKPVEKIEKPKENTRQVAQLPIEQQVGNKLKNSRVFEKMLEAEAEQGKSNLDAKDQPKYETMNIQEDRKRAVEFVENNYSKAKRVALGLENAPTGMTENNIRIAMAVKAEMDGDIALYNELVQSRSRKLTRAGQELVTERGVVDQNNADFYIKDLLSRRMDQVASQLPASESSKNKNVLKKKIENMKLSSTEKVNDRIDSETKDLKKELSVENIKISSAQEIIDMLTC